MIMDCLFLRNRAESLSIRTSNNSNNHNKMAVLDFPSCVNSSRKRLSLLFHLRYPTKITLIIIVGRTETILSNDVVEEVAELLVVPAADPVASGLLLTILLLRLSRLATAITHFSRRPTDTTTTTRLLMVTTSTLLVASLLLAKVTER